MGVVTLPVDNICDEVVVSEPVVHIHLLIVDRQGPRLDAPRLHVHYTDKNEYEILLIYKEIQKRPVAE